MSSMERVHCIYSTPHTKPKVSSMERVHCVYSTPDTIPEVSLMERFHCIYSTPHAKPKVSSMERVMEMVHYLIHLKPHLKCPQWRKSTV